MKFGAVVALLTAFSASAQSPAEADVAFMKGMVSHHAQALVYVLEGSIVMQIRGGSSVTLSPGQTWYEGPDDVHVVSRNASSSAAAKYVVFMVKDKGGPILTPVE